MWEFTLDTHDLFVSENIFKYRLFTYENFVVIVVVQLGWVAPCYCVIGWGPYVSLLFTNC